MRATHAPENSTGPVGAFANRRATRTGKDRHGDFLAILLFSESGPDLGAVLWITMKRNTKTKSTKKPARKATKSKPAKSKKPTLAAAIRRIRAKNAAFRRMGPTQKRVAIAKDVLEQLDLRRIQARSGTYFQAQKVTDFLKEYVDNKDDVDLSDIDTSNLRDVSKRLEQIADQTEAAGKTQVCDLIAGTKCTVCGIGAAFVSAVRLGDDLTVSQVTSDDVSSGIDDDLMRKYLRRYFSKSQVALIECAFEQDESFRYVDEDDGDFCDSVAWADDDDAVAAAEFGFKFHTDTARLRAIFENIIENDGKFVPPTLEDEVEDDENSSSVDDTCTAAASETSS